MPALRELQSRFAQALLGTGDIPADLVLGDGMAAATRLAVYRNNVCLSLKDALKDVFPAVCRVVDERFFLYAAEEFIKAHPPRQACLSAYGDRFADFIGAFPPCRGLVYLSDLARFEWLLHCAAHAAATTPLAPAALAAVAPGDAGRLVFRLDPSFGFLASPWPIDRIWSANSACAAAADIIDLDAGGARLELRRAAEDVVFRRLDEASFAFRAALAAGRPIEAAADSGLAADPAFDVTAALGDLFRDGAVIGLCHAPSTSEEAS